MRSESTHSRPPDVLTGRELAALAALGLVLRLAALRPDLAPAPPEAVAFGADAGAELLLFRVLTLLAGAGAVPLAAWAGGRLAGRSGAWAAGILLAVTPFALRHAGWVGPPSVLLLAGTALSVAVVLAGTDRRGAALLAAAAGAALAVLGLRWAPLTNVAPPDVVSPLLEGARRAAAVAGWAAALLAVPAILVGLFGRERPLRPLLGATFALFLVVLLREGPDPHALSLAVPGMLLLAAAGVGKLGVAGRGALAVAVAFAAFGAVGAIAANRGPGPREAARDWSRRHLSAGAAVLVEDPELDLPVARDDSRDKGFHAVEWPPAGVAGKEIALFYDPDNVRAFPNLILQDPPPGADPLRVEFHRFFRREWTEAARFGEGEYPRTAVTILKRPDGWKPDSVAVAPLREPLEGLQALRDTSTVYANWCLAAGEALRGSGAPEAAGPFLDAARGRADGGAEVWFETGLAQLLEGRFPEAMSSLHTALKLDPKHGPAHYNLGTLLEAEGDLNGAESEYRAAIRHLEDPTPAHVRLGSVHVRRGLLDEARAELAVVRRLAPGGEAEIFLTNLITEAEAGKGGSGGS